MQQGFMHVVLQHERKRWNAGELCINIAKGIGKQLLVKLAKQLWGPFYDELEYMNTRSAAWGSAFALMMQAPHQRKHVGSVLDSASQRALRVLHSEVAN